MKPLELLEEVINKSSDLDDNQMSEFYSMMCATSIACLRGIHGDKFVTDYLTTALNDSDKDSFVRVKH